MNVETCKVGPILTNCYIVEDDGRVMVIDPGDALTMIVADIHARPVEQIVVTHAHWDHIGALSGLAEVTGAPRCDVCRRCRTRRRRDEPGRP